MNKFSRSLTPNEGVDHGASTVAEPAQRPHVASVGDASDDSKTIIIAVARLRSMLDAPPGMFTHEAIAAARLTVRDLALRLRAAGYWTDRSDALRNITQILWETDRFLSDAALGSSASKPTADR